MSVASFRRWLFLLGLGGLALAGLVGGGLLWRLRNQGPEPPVVRLPVPDLEVAGAIEQAREGVRRARRSSEAWGRLGLLLAAHDIFAEADACFVQAERLDPREPRWPYYHALSLYAGYPEAALPPLRQAVALWGDRAETARLWLAEMLLEQGCLDEAGQHFRRVLRKDLDNLRAHYGLGRLAFERGDLAGSLYYLRRSVKAPFARKGSHTLLAKVYQQQGDTAAAAGELRQAAGLANDPPWPDPLWEEVQGLKVGRLARLDRATQLVRQDRFDEAEALLRQLVRDYPDSSRPWIILGRLCMHRNRLPDAERALRTAVDLDPDSADAHFLLGVTLLQRGQPAVAGPHFRRVIAVKPTDAAAHSNLGLCLRRQGDRAGAVEALRTAVRCNPQLVDAHLYLGEWLAEDGRPAEAGTHLRQAAALAPDSAEVKSRLTRVLLRMAFPMVF